MMIKDIYKEIEQKISLIELFETVTLKINLECKNNDYVINNVTIESENKETYYANLKNIVDELNQKKDNSNYQWRLFYLFKELFQLLEKSEYSFNYFRGQSDNWSIVPGILRDDTPTEFKHHFDSIYEKIAIEYPEDLKYIGFSDEELEDRVMNLSLLQHYGLRTSLVDITNNPFIALLFMTSDVSKKSFKCGSIDCFSIDGEQHRKNNIFIPVKKEKNNKRIRAQKGAFFCYDKLYSFDLTHSIKKIKRVRIEINYMFAEEDFKKLELSELKENKMFLDNTDTSHFDDNTLLEYERVRRNMDSFINNIQDDLEVFKEIKKEHYENVRKEISDKLKEYYYQEQELFPDLYKYIEYLQNSYLKNNLVRFFD